MVEPNVIYKIRELRNEYTKELRSIRARTKYLNSNEKGQVYQIEYFIKDLNKLIKEIDSP